MNKKISINQFDYNKPDFSNPSNYLPKDKTVLNWLISIVKKGLEDNTFAPGDLMPTKGELSKLLGVSIGTVQNAIRHAEDLGYFESKQRIGTLIRDYRNSERSFEKMSSKKDMAVDEIKKIISRYEINQPLPSARVISTRIGASHNTTRLALNSLIEEGILVQRRICGKVSLVVIKKIENENAQDLVIGEITNKTLSQKLADKIKKYIKENYREGDKIITNEELAQKFKVSIRTVNEATKILNNEGIIISRRGQYGTIYTGEKKEEKRRSSKSMFMTNPIEEKKENLLYNWERAIKELKKYIIKNFEAGDKIPSISELSSILKTSTNTVRKVVNMLCKQDVLYTQRGKYGGTYINSMPEGEESYAWVALNPKYLNK